MIKPSALLLLLVILAIAAEATPSITKVYPLGGATGSSVTITLLGTDFGTATDDIIAVKYGSDETAVSCSSAYRQSDTKIIAECTVSTTAVSLYVWLTTSSSSSTLISSAYSQFFSPYPTPTLTSIDASSSIIGQPSNITIHGTNLGTINEDLMSIFITESIACNSYYRIDSTAVVCNIDVVPARLLSFIVSISNVKVTLAAGSFVPTYDANTNGQYTIFTDMVDTGQKIRWIAPPLDYTAAPSLTVSFHVKIDNNDGAHRNLFYLSSDDYDYGHREPGIYVTPGTPNLYIHMTPADPVTVNNYALPLSEWAHIVLTIGNNKMRLYINGILDFEQSGNYAYIAAAASVKQLWTSIQPFTVGNPVAIKSMNLFNRVISLEEINQLSALPISTSLTVSQINPTGAVMGTTTQVTITGSGFTPATGTVKARFAFATTWVETTTISVTSTQLICEFVAAGYGHIYLYYYDNDGHVIDYLPLSSTVFGISPDTGNGQYTIFNGPIDTNQRIRWPAPPLDYTTAPSLTVSFHVKIDNNDGGHRSIFFLTDDDSDYGRREPGLWVTPSTPNLYVHMIPAEPIIVNNIALPLSEWAHIVLTIGNNKMRLYINGILDFEQTANYAYLTPSAMGKHIWTSMNPYTTANPVILKSLNVFNRVVSREEMNQLSVFPISTSINITQISPLGAVTGATTSITITGQGFTPATGIIKARFAFTSTWADCITKSITDTQIICEVISAGVGHIYLYHYDSTTNQAMEFYPVTSFILAVWQAPTVTSVSPTIATASSTITVTITGTNFGTDSSDLLAIEYDTQTTDSQSCQSINWISDTQVTCTLSIPYFFFKFTIKIGGTKVATSYGLIRPIYTSTYCISPSRVTSGYPVSTDMAALCAGGDSGNVVLYTGELCGDSMDQIQWNMMQNWRPVSGLTAAQCLWNRGGDYDWNNVWVGQCGVAPASLPFMPTHACASTNVPSILEMVHVPTSLNTPSIRTLPPANYDEDPAFSLTFMLKLNSYQTQWTNIFSVGSGSLSDMNSLYYPGIFLRPLSGLLHIRMGSSILQSSFLNLPTGQWFFIVIKFNINSIQLIINGQLDSELTWPLSLSTTLVWGSLTDRQAWTSKVSSDKTSLLAVDGQIAALNWHNYQVAADSFTYLAGTTTVTSVSPSTAAPGSNVNIVLTGTNFPADAAVKLGDGEDQWTDCGNVVVNTDGTSISCLLMNVPVWLGRFYVSGTTIINDQPVVVVAPASQAIFVASSGQPISSVSPSFAQVGQLITFILTGDIFINQQSSLSGIYYQLVSSTDNIICNEYTWINHNQGSCTIYSMPNSHLKFSVMTTTTQAQTSDYLISVYTDATTLPDVSILFSDAITTAKSIRWGLPPIDFTQPPLFTLSFHINIPTSFTSTRNVLFIGSNSTQTSENYNLAINILPGDVPALQLTLFNNTQSQPITISSQMYLPLAHIMHVAYTFTAITIQLYIEGVLDTVYTMPYGWSWLSDIDQKQLWTSVDPYTKSHPITLNNMRLYQRILTQQQLSPLAVVPTVRSVSITSIYPRSSLPDTATEITITGRGFTSVSADNLQVIVGAGSGIWSYDPYTAIIDSDTKLRITINKPLGNYRFFVRITTSQGLFTSLASTTFTTKPVAIITGVDPTNSPAASSVTMTITGSNFGLQSSDLISVGYLIGSVKHSCTSKQWLSPTQVTCTIISMPTNTFNIIVNILDQEGVSVIGLIYPTFTASTYPSKVTLISERYDYSQSRDIATPPVDYSQSTPSLTFSFYFKLGQIHTNFINIFHFHSDDEGGTRNPALWIYPSQTNFHFRMRSTQSTNDGIDQSTVSIPLNQWVHIAGTISATTMILYIDAVPQTYELPAGHSFQIVGPVGKTIRTCHTGWCPGYTDTYIQQFDWYTSVLTQQQISALSAAKTMYIDELKPPVVVEDPACAYDTTDVGLSPYLHHTTSFTNNKFYIAIAVPSNYKFINFTFMGSNTNQCLGNRGWSLAQSTESVDECMTLHTHLIDWSNLHDYCGAQSTVTTTSIQFRLFIQLDAAQSINMDFNQDDIYDTSVFVDGLFRTLSNTFPLQVTFPRRVTATSNSTVGNDVATANKAVLQGVRVSPNPNIIGSTMEMTVLSITHYPNKVIAPVSVIVPDDTTLTITAGSEKCVAQVGKLCAQTWNIHVESTSDTKCTFSGDYTLLFPLICQESWNEECPETNFTSTLHVKTTNHCPTVSTAKLDSQLTTYSDATYETEAIAYHLRNWVYGELTTSSETASITSVALDSVTIKVSGSVNDIVLMADANITRQGQEAGCTFTSSTTIGEPTSARYACKLMAKHIPMSTGGTKTLTWYVTAAVEFQHTASISNAQTLSTNRNKRMLITSEFHTGINQYQHHPITTQSSKGHAEAVIMTKVLPNHDEEYDELEDYDDDVDIDISASYYLSPSVFIIFATTLMSLLLQLF